MASKRRNMFHKNKTQETTEKDMEESEPVQTFELKSRDDRPRPRLSPPQRVREIFLTAYPERAVFAAAVPRSPYRLESPGFRQLRQAGARPTAVASLARRSCSYYVGVDALLSLSSVELPSAHAGTTTDVSDNHLDVSPKIL
ncbi:hypothetical protein AAG570_009527 [Ranatra chinensis]|uniref:Uncharacterized protein n=1 Tax=Ranatra chinensis TaxID=642074 RepID=A0ABD0YPE1_9HEMI